MKLNKTLIVTILFTLILGGCGLNSQRTPADKRQFILNMQKDTLKHLFRIKPHARRVIHKSVGYAVFSNANVNLILASVTGGYGVATNTHTGHKTYMRMGEIGFGLGLGIKDFRVIFVFHTKSSLRHFIRQGWNVGAHADATAKASNKGKAYTGEALIGGITIYHITKSGLALQATLKGTKFWKDKHLN